jgi:short-subunit dehydrogenase
MKELKGRCAIVTGASRGIGVHIARALSAQGMRVALVARSAEPIERLASELSVAGTPAVAIAADLAQLSELDRVLARAEAELGAIDVLVNNAGIDAYRFYSSESDAQTEQMLRLDLLCPMLLTRKLLPKWLARGTGHVVNIASLAGKTSTPCCVSYATAKAGLIAFTHNLRAELQGTGVSASVISPGFISDEGAFAVRKRAQAVQVSRVLGESSARAVATAVLSALRADRAEIVVNPGPMRLMQAFNQLAPEAMLWFQERIGVNGMLRTLARAESTSDPVDKLP